MKKISTESTFFAKSGAIKLVIAFVLFVFSASLLQAQQSTARDLIGDLTGQVWKSSTDIDVLVQAETARMDAAIANPDTPEPDRALFEGYKRLVGYVQLGIQAGSPVDEALYAGYDKVIAESLEDPLLKQMPEGTLINLVPTLVESLIAVPEPVNFQGQ
jgi:hypothetical protein